MKEVVEMQKKAEEGRKTAGLDHDHAEEIRSILEEMEKKKAKSKEKVQNIMEDFRKKYEDERNTEKIRIAYLEAAMKEMETGKKADKKKTSGKCQKLRYFRRRRCREREGSMNEYHRSVKVLSFQFPSPS